VKEHVQSPEKIGAFFDIDGTLLPSPSLEWRFIGHLLAQDKIGSADVGRWLVHCARNLLRDPRDATIGNKRYLAGLAESLVADWESSLDPAIPGFFAEGIGRIAEHLAQGHRVFLISGTLEPLARAVARRLPGQIEVCATRLEMRGAHWTGRLAGEHMSGEAKARAIRALAVRYGLALWDSYAYGNSITDLPMLDSVGHRAAVNPSSRLRRITRNESWQTCDWTQASAAVPGTSRHKLSPQEAT
jgi:HAD superfamily hydrolase (TIGR01490 family)